MTERDFQYGFQERILAALGSAEYRIKRDRDTCKFQEQVLAALSKIEGSLATLVAANEPDTLTSISFKFQQKEQHPQKMALTAPLNTQSEKFYIIGTDASGTPGAQLGSGQTIVVTSADTSIVSFTRDPTALAYNEGVASVASGSVNFLKVGGPVTVSAAVTNADGTPAETISDTVTVTPATAGVAVSMGILFETLLAVKP
jgi:hypothetical protein